MTSYAGVHATLYDIFYGDKPYREEAHFIDEIVRRRGVGPPGPLLDVACGTGRHARAFEDLGYAVTGIDHSSEMLSVARSAQPDGSISFVEADMRAFEVGDRFKVAVCLFDSIGYAASKDGVLQVLARVRSALQPGGLFACEFWHLPAMLRNFEPVRVRRWTTPEGEIIRVSETQLRREEQLADVDYTIIDLRSHPSIIRERQTNRYFTVDEMDSLLISSGFEALEHFAGYNEDQQITDDTWHVVVVASSRS